MSLDLPALVDGLKRNNVGFGGLTIRADFAIKDGKATLAATGQSFPWEGPEPASGATSTRTLRVRDAATPARTRVEPLP
jgi:hypothetical protein